MTLHWAQLSGCVVTVSDFTDLVANLIFLLDLGILLVFVAFSGISDGSLGAFPASD